MHQIMIVEFCEWPSTINIDWGLNKEDLIISNKDTPLFSNLKSPLINQMKILVTGANGQLGSELSILSYPIQNIIGFLLT